MMDTAQYVDELETEKGSLDPDYHPHAIRLLSEEIKRIESLTDGDKTLKEEMDSFNNNTADTKSEVRERKPNYMRQYQPEIEPSTKLFEKVMIPIKKYPKFNFVGRLLGPKGLTFKRLQSMTGCKMSILGQGSMRDKEKEQELLDSNDPKYDHLKEELHVLIEVDAPKAEAHGRLAAGIAEVQKFLVPDPNDPIRQEQMRELAYLNGIEQGSTTVAAPHVTTVIANPIIRGRGRSRGVTVRGAHVVRPRTIPRAAVVTTQRHATTAPETYTYETHEAGYEFEQAYPEGEVVYYTAAESTFTPGTGAIRLKAPVRSIKRDAREATYPY
ncbi:KH domain-containing, RNA-binding, signal transduction-associated protein 2-like [Xenia sp. Carnegie-2017]|uniref:KH domain-containing, RNA-binding, signal transduction-associated protein 2-like n=1 Tax=Xenia sp. Carnegie-2017 TaxID=2897299 RepID=UPI001F04EB7E|nr:KH domain-containing, RNA-binding, signal transduction-associated protein 2-like [Xenia sp. Carnegie-2017]XP_046856920.1 KH domain-containing, RNA-binding, signal transduction-associated protein 2-like [Xenia sp. Carnegie-2017]